MRQIIKKSHHATIERDGDKVIKTFTVPKKRWMRDWWHHYDAYYNMYGGVPRVYDVNENMIVMDYVKGVAVEHHFWKDGNLNHGVAYKVFATVLQNLSNMADYSSMVETVWFHNDAGVHNYIFNGDEYILVDPDSFILSKNPYPGAFVSPLHPLHNILTHIYSIHERDYRREHGELHHAYNEHVK